MSGPRTPGSWARHPEGTTIDVHPSNQHPPGVTFDGVPNLEDRGAPVTSTHWMGLKTTPSSMTPGSWSFFGNTAKTLPRWVPRNGSSNASRRLAESVVKTKRPKDSHHEVLWVFSTGADAPLGGGSEEEETHRSLGIHRLWFFHTQGRTEHIAK